jgi:hypothetical protein
MRKQAQPVEADTDQPRKEVSGRLEADRIGDVEREGTRATWGMIERRSPTRIDGAIRRFEKGDRMARNSEATRNGSQPGPEDEDSGATQNLIVGDTGDAKRRGNLELSQPAPPKERESRRLDDRSPVKPEVRNEGQPEVRIAGEAGGSRSHRGNSEPCGNRQRRRHRKQGETRAEIAGIAEGTKKMAQTIGIGRRLNKTGAGKGQPGTETQVEREDQGTRPTRT